MRWREWRSLRASLVLLTVLLFSSACATFPLGSAQAYLERGIALYESGRYADAARAFEEAIAEDPTLAKAYVYLARAQLQLGQWFAALATLGDGLAKVPPSERKALVADLLDSFIQTALGLLREGKPGDATTILTRLHEIAPESPEARSALIDALLANGRHLLGDRSWKEAIEQFVQALRLSPKELDAYIGLARGYFSSGELTRAIEALRQALDIAPNNGEARELMRRLLRT